MLAVAVVLVAAALWAPASDSAAATPGCPYFHTQAAAQAYFMEHHGSPSHGVGRLDPDRDGVACEGLGGPYQGFATVGYNKKRDFFYGVASMPSLAHGDGEFACLAGNRRWPNGPRWFNVYRVRPAGEDIAVLGTDKRAAEAMPVSGRLLWRADKREVLPGRYYVAFEESVRTSPYGANPCPEFRSRAVRLP